MRKTTQHTVSHRAGVLLGNHPVKNNINEQSRLTTATIRNNPNDMTLLREFANDSKASNGEKGILKSVYDMRVSHSNLAAKNAKIQQSNSYANKDGTANTIGKRKHLQSAVTRTTR